MRFREARRTSRYPTRVGPVRRTGAAKGSRRKAADIGYPLASSYPRHAAAASRDSAVTPNARPEEGPTALWFRSSAAGSSPACPSDRRPTAAGLCLRSRGSSPSDRAGASSACGIGASRLTGSSSRDARCGRSKVKAARSIDAQVTRALAAFSERARHVARRIVVFLGARRQRLDGAEALPLANFLAKLPQ
jgi:hypothetical protein